jgi:hypothetical protein
MSISATNTTITTASMKQALNRPIRSRTDSGRESRSL